jgi:hypothetical protein
MMSTRRLWRHLTTHCEPAFAALKQAFGNRYIYAGAGASLQSGSSAAAGERRGERPALEEDDLATYRKLARRETRSAFAREVRNDSSSHVASVLGAACPGPQIGVKRQVSGGAQGCRRMGEHTAWARRSLRREFRVVRPVRATPARPVRRTREGTPANGRHESG